MAAILQCGRHIDNDKWSFNTIKGLLYIDDLDQQFYIFKVEWIYRIKEDCYCFQHCRDFLFSSGDVLATDQSNTVVKPAKL